MKWYLDESIQPKVAEALSLRHRIHAVSSHQVGMNGSSAQDQLLFASEAGYVLVSGNVPDLLRLAHLWTQRRQEFAGIGLLHAETVPLADVGAQVRAIAGRERRGPWPGATVEFLASD